MATMRPRREPASRYGAGACKSATAAEGDLRSEYLYGVRAAFYRFFGSGASPVLRNVVRQKSLAMNEHNIRLTTATTVYDRIKDDILSGSLAPSLKLRIEFVCERYGTGASPVREALNRLSQDGLAERRDQRGFYVAPVSLEQLAELVKTRCWLEAIALRESIVHRTAEWEERLVLAFHRLSRTPRSLDN